MGVADLQIQEKIETARREEARGGWVTYLIRDPCRPDRKGNVAGWPIYVGQTDEFGKRVRNHLRKSEKLARRGAGIKYLLKELLHAGVVPNFEVLDRQPTRLKSLISETNFARLCRRRGYDIANATTLQNRAGPPITANDVPTKWLWAFKLEQATEDNLQLELVCCCCRTTVPMDLGIFAALTDPPKSLRDIRDNPTWHEEPCGSCDERSCRKIRVRIA